MYLYTVGLNELVVNVTRKRQHSGKYVFTVVASNNAGLISIQQMDILVDDSSPRYVGGFNSMSVEILDDKIYCLWSNDTLIDKKQMYTVDFVVFRIGKRKFTLLCCDL